MPGVSAARRRVLTRGSVEVANAGQGGGEERGRYVRLTRFRQECTGTQEMGHSQEGHSNAVIGVTADDVC